MIHVLVRIYVKIPFAVGRAMRHLEFAITEHAVRLALWSVRNDPQRNVTARPPLEPEPEPEPDFNPSMDDFIEVWHAPTWRIGAVHSAATAKSRRRRRKKK